MTIIRPTTIAVLVAIPLWAAAAAALSADPPKDSPDAPKKAEGGKSTAIKFRTTADEIAEEFKKDAKAAAAKYKDAVILVSGTVESCTHDPQGRGGVIWMDTKAIGGCRVITVEKEPWAEVSKGSKIRAKGKIGEGRGAVLVDAVLVETSPNPAIKTTAEKLAKDYSADKNKAKATYNLKAVIIEGEVLESGKDAKGIERILLKGDGQVPIALYFSPATHEKRHADLKPGQKVTVTGEVGLAPDFYPEPRVDQCLIISK